jgi:hypothetical protein
MRKATSIVGSAALAAAAALLAAACGQDEVTLPDPEGAEVGECGAWYPGGAEDSGVIYGSAEGDTLPCFVWDSVRAGEQIPSPDPATYANAYLSMGEIFLKAREPEMSALLEAQFGVDEAKAVIFFVVADQCSGCPELLERLAASLPEMREDHAIAIGVASFDAADSDPNAAAMSLADADDLLVSDGFDESLYRTNDPEHYLGASGSFAEGFPQIIGVRLRDMAVRVRGVPNTYYDQAGDGLLVDTLLEAILGDGV